MHFAMLKRNVMTEFHSVKLCILVLVFMLYIPVAILALLIPVVTRMFSVRFASDFELVYRL